MAWGGRSAEDLLTLVGGCFALLTEQVQRYDGTITQFTNDSIMALFGASMTHEDHAGRALHAALGVQAALREYQEKGRARLGGAVADAARSAYRHRRRGTDRG